MLILLNNDRIVSIIINKVFNHEKSFCSILIIVFIFQIQSFSQRSDLLIKAGGIKFSYKIIEDEITFVSKGGNVDIIIVIYPYDKSKGSRFYLSNGYSWYVNEYFSTTDSRSTQAVFYEKDDVYYTSIPISEAKSWSGNFYCFIKYKGEIYPNADGAILKAKEIKISDKNENKKVKIDDEIYYNLAIKRNTVLFYQTFLRTFPNSVYIDLVKSKIENVILEKENNLFEKANTGTLTDCKKYKEQYPKGRFIDKVEARLQSLNKEELLLKQKKEQERIAKENEKRKKIEEILSRKKEDVFFDTRDNKIYKTIKIGNQTWFAENLRYKLDVRHSYITYYYDANQLNYYDGFKDIKYGLLYNFNGASNACPYGWHLPSNQEYNKLFEIAGIGYINLKDQSELNQLEIESVKILSGFNLLPAGYYIDDFNRHFYGYVDDAAFLWTSTKEHISGNNYNYHFMTIDFRDHKFFPYKNPAFYLSVRCIKDSVIVSSTSPSQNEKKVGLLRDTRDNKTYKTIKIGDQIWMAENLKYKPGGQSWAYDNKESNVEIYGRLYNWETALDVCPNGWHLPNENEWDKLIEMYGGSKQAGEKLKSEYGWKSYIEEKDALFGDNHSGFNAIPSGVFDYDSFSGVGSKTSFWSSTPHNETNGLRYVIRNNANFANGNEMLKKYGYSVRCIKD